MMNSIRLIAVLGYLSVTNAIQLNLYSDNACQNFIGQINPYYNPECDSPMGAGSALLVDDQAVTCGGFTFLVGDDNCTPDQSTGLAGLNYACPSEAESNEDVGKCLDLTALPQQPQHVSWNQGFEW